MTHALTQKCVPTLLKVSVLDTYLCIILFFYCCCPARNCSGGMIFRLCGSACNLNVTCENVDMPRTCAEVCVSDCFCPTGTALQGDACTQCPASSCELHNNNAFINLCFSSICCKCIRLPCLLIVAPLPVSFK